MGIRRKWSNPTTSWPRSPILVVVWNRLYHNPSGMDHKPLELIHEVSGTGLRTWTAPGEVGTTVTSLQMSKLRSWDRLNGLSRGQENLDHIVHTSLLQRPQSLAQRWQWDARTASVYSLPRTPGKQHPSHCSLAYLLIKHFVRASGFLSSKQNSSFLQKKAISSMSKLPISFHCCFLE